MRYEDASGAFQASGPIANDDADTLAAGSRGPATGNLITGEGTQYGAAGADSAAGAHVTAIGGKGGEDSSFAGGKLSVEGAYGQLSVDAEGNYSYLANKGAPENVRDRFTYTLADNQGNSDTAALIVEIGKTPAVIKADATQIVPGPDGVVTLPPGVELSDIMVVGRNLVINMPDGTQLIIVDGAVFVPQLVLGGVEVPATNVATLLIGQEPQPAAGELPPSSGGNFALPPPPLDPGIPLGDLIPPTEYNYIPPEPQELFPAEDSEPTIVIQPDGQPAAVNAVDEVNEKGLPGRDGNLPDEPEGSGEEAAAGADGDPSEATAGTIIIDSPDGVDSVTINGVLVTGVVGQQIDGEFGTLTITGFDGDNILYSYLLNDNTSGDATHDDFSVTLTDSDGDQATATLVIDIIDDVPTARDDTDAVIKGDTSTDGNVMTSVGTTNSPAGTDTVGADNATLTGIHPGTSGSFTAVPGGGVTVVGTFGDLTINPDGSYTYTLHAEVGNGGTDVFTYQLTDGDGDTDAATLTITVPPDLKPVVGPNPDVIVDDDAFAGGNPGGTGDDPNAVNLTGTLSGSGGDGPLTFAVLLTGAPAGFTYESGGAGVVLIKQGGVTVLTVTVDSDGSYTVVQNAVIDHAAGGNENNQPFTINYTVTDVDGDSANGSVTISVDDDTPLANNDSDSIAAGSLGPAVGNVITGSGTNEGTGNADSPGADGFDSIVGLASNNVPANIDNDASGGFVVDGQYGTLTLQTDGSYSYARDPGSPGGVSDVFTYTYVDQDGDTVSATLTIDIANSVPDVPENVDVGLDDDALANGNPGGTGDDPDAVNTSGSVAAVGGDGTITYELSDAGAPVGFTYQLQGNGDLWILQGATHVLTVTLDQSGNYTVSQVNPIDHSAGGDENNTDFTVTFSATDVDNDSDSGTFTISVDDDTPELSEVVSQGGVDVDESDAGSPAGFPISDTSALPMIDFTAAFGADGAAAVNDTVFGLAITGGPASGLQTAVGDFAITLVQIDGDTIEGHYNGSNVAFIIQMNGDGTVTLTQNVALEHLVDGPPGPAHNDTLDLAGLIAATVTITDGDGDSTSAQAGIGGDLVFFDDGPDAVNDTDTVGAPGSTATGNVITDNAVGDQGDSDNGADDPGADAPATVTNLVSVNEPGNTDQDPAAGVFEIQGEFGVLVMNADGSYTYTRDAGTPGGGQDVFTYTLTDSDGDTDTATLTITLADDRPVATTSAATVDDEGLAGGILGGSGDLDANVGETTPSASEAVFNGTLGGTPGDGTTTFFFPASLDGDVVVIGQENVTLDVSPDGLTITGTGPRGLLFTINITDAESGEYTLTLNDNVLHETLNGLAGDNTENNATLVLDYQMEDADGDLSLSPGQLTITFDDDIPTVTNVQPGASVDLDETDAGSPSGFPISDTSAGAVITATQAFGADGAAAANSVVYGLAIVGGSPQPSGLATAIGDHAITLVAIDSDTIEGQYQDGGTQVAFTIQMNANGTVTLTQEVPLEHLQDGGPAFFNDTLDLDGLINATITITDADGDSASGSAPIGDNLVFFDDGPDAQVDGEATLDQLVLDETRPVGQDSDSGDNDPGGLATVNANFADNFVSPVDYGGDGAGTTAYSLVLSANGIGSGLYALDNSDTDAGDGDGYGQGDEILLTQAGNVITGAVNGTTYFTITINPVTGVVTFAQVNNVWHADTSDDDDTSSLMTDAASNIQVVQTVTDSDGDFDTASINIGQGVFHIEDDGPEILAVDNTLDIPNTGPTPSGTGDFDFDIGTDAPNGGNDDISVSNFNIQVNGVDADNIVFNEGVENATTASYSFTFEYDTGAGGTANGAGTLVFDKVAGTYTVELDAPIAGFTIVQTSDLTTTFDEYDLDGGAPDVVVATLADDLFAQFVAVSTNNNGTPHLLTTVGNNTAWNPGELFTADPGNPQVSHTDAGVDGNTMDTGEVLDFNLYSADPGSDTTPAVPTAFATDMFMQFFQYAGDDLIVVLKLGRDSNDDGTLDQFTTRAIIVDPTDLFYDSDSATGTAYEGLVAGLGSQDALLVIESNDYNAEGEDWVITGAQIVTDEDGTSGSGVNLVGGLGDAGASDTNGDGSFTGGETQAFSSDTDVSGVKITSIGFLIQDTTDQSATIDFDVTVTDADGDAQTESITVNVGDPVSPMPVPFSSTSQEEQLQKTAANSNTLTLAAAVAAAGISEQAAAHHDSGNDHGQNSDLVTAYAPETVEHFSVDDGGDNAAVSLLADEPQAENSAPADSSSNSSDASGSSNVLDDSPAPAAAEASDHGSSGSEASAQAAADASPVAPTVAMVSAEALQAAGVEGNAQHGGSVEQVVADALGQGDAPTVDAVLANLPGGNGQLQALAHMASPAAEAVSAWDMGGHGAGAAMHQMMLSMHAANMHHDAVQPVANG